MLATHLFGTCRAGTDPKTSVVDPYLRVHGVNGVYVMDASVFPSNTGVNPQHSIMAIATVAAKRLAAETQLAPVPEAGDGRGLAPRRLIGDRSQNEFRRHASDTEGRSFAASRDICYRSFARVRARRGVSMRVPSMLVATVMASGCAANIPLSAGDPGGGGGTSTTNPDGGGTILDDGGTVSCSDSDGMKANDTVVMSELVFGTSPFVEFYNNGGVQMDLTNFTLQGSATYLSTAPMQPGERVENPDEIDSTSGELALLNSSGAIIQYVCWGQPGVTTLQNSAGSTGVWLSGDNCVPSPPTGESLHLVGVGKSSTDWAAEDETILGCPVGDH